MGNLVPEQRADKNGKVTTRHIRANQVGSVGGASMSAVKLPALSQEAKAPITSQGLSAEDWSQMDRNDLLGTLLKDLKSDWWRGDPIQLFESYTMASESGHRGTLLATDIEGSERLASDIIIAVRDQWLETNGLEQNRMADYHSHPNYRAYEEKFEAFRKSTYGDG